MKNHFVKGFVSLLGILTATGVSPSMAQTWDGGAGTRNMADANNWVGDVAPTSSIDTVLQFTGNQTDPSAWVYSGGNLNQNLGNSFDVNSLQFSGTYSNASLTYIMSGNSFEMRTNSSAVAPTLVWNTSVPASINYQINNNFILTNTLTVSGTGNGELIFNGILSGAGGLEVNRTINLRGLNTYSGTTNVNSGGTLSLRYTTTGDFSNSNINVNNGGTVASRSDGANLTYDHQMTVNSGGVLRVTRNNLQFSGTLILNGEAGGSNSFTTEQITITSTGQLTGTGTFIQTGTNTLDAGVTINGTIAPGNSGSGVMTFTNDVSGTPLNVTIGATGDYVWQLTALSEIGAGTNFDQIALTGSQSANLTLISGAELTLSLGSLAPNFGNAFWTTNRSWMVVNNSSLGTLTGSFAAIDNSAWTSFGTFSTSGIGNDVLLNWTAVPEPSTWMLLAGGLTWLVVARRRRMS